MQGGRERALGLLVALAALLASCEAPRSQRDTLRIAITALPAQVGNPFRYTGLPAAFITAAIFDALTVLDEKGRPQPALALSWQQVDPTRWRFELRRGVSFSNGAPLDAAAVAQTVNYLRSDEAIVENMRSDLANVLDAQVIDTHVVEIRTSSPDALLPRQLSMLNIVEPAQWRRLGRVGFAREPVGTGPFKVEHFGPTSIRLSAFEGSWRAPRVAKLEYLAVPDATARVQALQSGRADVSLLLGPDDLPQLEVSGERVLIYPTGGVFAVVFITEGRRSAVNDARVRRALNLAVDKASIVRNLLRGNERVAAQPATHQAFGFDPAISPYPYDPEQAKRLLQAAGHGAGLTLTMEAVPGTIAADAAILQQVAVYLARVNVKLVIRAVPFATYNQRYTAGDWAGQAFAVFYLTAPTLDALRPLTRHSCAWSRPWYCDPEAMPLIEAARAAPDLATRERLTRKVMSRYHEQAAAIYLHEVSGYLAHSARVQGLRINYTQLALHEVSLQ